MPDEIEFSGNFTLSRNAFIKLIREVAGEEVEKRLGVASGDQSPFSKNKTNIVDYVGDEFRRLGIKDASLYGELDKLRSYASLEVFRRELVNVIREMVDNKI